MMKRTRSDDLADALRALLAGKPGAREHAERELAAHDATHKAVAASQRAHSDSLHPVEIGGQRFVSRNAAMKYARTLGFNGSNSVFATRDAKGLPWAEIIKPVDPVRSARRRDANERKKAEMKAVLDDMDARR